MLQRVLSEDCKIEFKNYGIIEIPKGTMVHYKGDKECCLVAELDWIDEKYPAQSKKMKVDVLEDGIRIPIEKLMLALRLQFIYDDSGNCLDIYKNVYGNKRYCRMQSLIKDKVQWLTITDDWDEPECPLRSDMLIQLTGKDGKVIITEQQVKIGDEYATEKILPFSWEKSVTEEQKRFMNLIYN